MPTATVRLADARIWRQSRTQQPTDLGCRFGAGRDCLLVAAADVIRVSPGPNPGDSLNVQYLLDRNTLAMKGALIHLEDIAGRDVPVEPVVFQSRANVFLDPFADSPLHQEFLISSLWIVLSINHPPHAAVIVCYFSNFFHRLICAARKYLRCRSSIAEFSLCRKGIAAQGTWYYAS